jgi:molecular chaperone GrpE
VNKEELQKEVKDLTKEKVCTESEEAKKTDDVASEEVKKEDAKAEEKKEEKQEEKKENNSSQQGKKGPRKKTDKAKERIDELEDKLKRQLAEFENFRKRTELEKTARFDMGAKSVLEKVLPVVDNFERGLNGVAEDKEEDSFVSGMNKVYKQLMTELETIGVEPIVAIGEEFNPELHNAVMQVESEEYEAGIIAQELLKGYKYKGMVLRHSMVAVVN